jgi:hypothetical protein
LSSAALSLDRPTDAAGPITGPGGSAGPAEPARSGALARERFIVSPRFDLFFFVGSPLLAIAAILSAREVFSPISVEGAVLTYLAVGHHVPTFLRAYGDPDEYRRNRFRLLVIPATVLPLIALLFLLDSRLLGMIFVWDQYHFVRQHYGFMRIYDVKNKSLAPSGRFNLDQLLCFSWFIAIIAWSDFYSFVYTGYFYDLGVVFPAWLGPAIKQGSLAVALAVAFAYAVHLFRRISTGQPVSWLKLAITATTYGTWYFAYVTLAHPMLSYAISSAFHCLQYDALAWHYNRTKANSLEPNRGNALFRTVHSKIWLFVAAVGGYGLFSQLGGMVVPGAVFVLNRTTGILHYYFDSFIWRVRREEFRKHL